MIDDKALDILFREARTHSAWLPKPVAPEILKQVYDLAKMAPTSANCSPMRVVFVQSQEAKEKLKPCLAEGNIDKTMTAPVTALIASDYEFYNQLPKLFPHADAKSWFVGNDDLINISAFRNGTLQGAYLMLAARACGLDCGPMSGFDSQKLDEAFFTGTSFKSNFICNLGYGDASALFPRSPRFDFEEACKIV
ncbi:malonic semialdehyde reductase [Candidatus Paracaedibacter symbiosus]|uniref:malonic semialdehyde reductase n=1 Tax=Candidatus Paracaedibacter symbiosus TaxID=244582 RepID=UPI000509F18F|nr:malonic semialdehyde reductase [Candidatus Paracaedibacter symbiosus]